MKNLHWIGGIVKLNKIRLKIKILKIEFVKRIDRI